MSRQIFFKCLPPNAKNYAVSIKKLADTTSLKAQQISAFKSQMPFNYRIFIKGGKVWAITMYLGYRELQRTLKKHRKTGKTLDSMTISVYDKVKKPFGYTFWPILISNAAGFLVLTMCVTESSSALQDAVKLLVSIPAYALYWLTRKVLRIALPLSIPVVMVWLKNRLRGYAFKGDGLERSGMLQKIKQIETEKK